MLMAVTHILFLAQQELVVLRKVAAVQVRLWSRNGKIFVYCLMLSMMGKTLTFRNSKLININPCPTEPGYTLPLQTV